MARKKATPEPPPEPKPEPAESPDSRGVPGGQHNRHRLADLKLRLHALNERWAVPADLKAETINQVRAIYTDKKSHERTRVAAGRLLVSMSSVNLQAIDTSLRANQAEVTDERLDAVERRLDEQDSSSQQS
jgi:hypothetical protein